ncbi:MAG TPA: ribose-5-phosphate isomerase RpiA [Methylovirgula sp.]|nr:ribose-5-phosphate isomerase RpiA [Methylovirgula sp.]
MDSQNPETMKRRAAAAALELVTPGMRLGLGTGSTAAHFVDLLGEKVAQGLSVSCVPTSERTRQQAEKLGIPLFSPEKLSELDLTVDGADEFDPELRLIKGGGGALWREKIVAAASKRLIVIVDSSKAVATLGRFALPIEVSAFGYEATRTAIQCAAEATGATGPVGRRKDKAGAPVISDSGNWIVDCALGVIPKPEELAERLSAIPGVVEHGLFIGLATAVISAGPEGIKIYGQLE